MLVSARQGGTQTSAFFEVILIHECQHSLNEKGTKNCHSVPSPFFIPTHVYTRMLVYTHAHERKCTRAHAHTLSAPRPALPCPGGLGVPTLESCSTSPMKKK